MNKVLMIAAAVFVVSMGTARADEGTWNAGASNLLIGNPASPGSGNAGMSNNLPNSTGGEATVRAMGATVRGGRR